MPRLWVLGAALCLLPAFQTWGDLIVQDGFDDGGRTNGADPLDVGWFRRFNTTSFSIVVDNGSPGIGTGNALNVDNGQSATPIVGVLSNAVLLESSPNFTIQLRFDFRLTTRPNEAASFRFGLHNSNGTAVTADDQTVSDNDFGYWAFVGTATSGSTLGIGLRKESGGTGTLMVGADNTILTNVFNSVFITDADKYSATFSLIRSSLSQVTLSAVIRNASGTVIESATATDSSSIFTSFDEITFAINTGTGATDFILDNVVLETIPEATSTAMAVGVAALWLWRIRWRAR